MHFYNTKLFNNCFLILHHISSSSCSSLWNFLFQVWFFACHLYYRPKRLSSGSPAPHFFFNFFNWLFPLWYSLAQHLLQNIFFSFFCFTLLLWFSLELRYSPTLWLQLYLKKTFSVSSCWLNCLLNSAIQLFLSPTNSLSISFSLCPCLTCHIGFFLEIFLNCFPLCYCICYLQFG